uniref:Uncharacterized protein n=1 Tax=Ditylenchus dipsaci TaxID=166011 RepID=A0A915E229_9BILA
MFLPIEPIEVISVDDRKRCMDFCLTNTACRAINYNTANGTCEVLDQAWRAVAGGLADHPEFDYYENTCFQEKSRCPSQRRIDFLITKNAELEAFDVAAGQLSVRNCMRECVESDSLFCRSFEYNHATKECFLAVEGYDQIVPKVPSLPAAITSSEHFDLFEPVCLDEAIDLPCQGDHVFERLPNMNLLNEGEPLIHKKCCAQDPRKSHKRKFIPSGKRNSVKICVKLSQTHQQDISSDASQIHQNSSPGSDTATPVIICDTPRSVLIERGRTLRLEYRNLHHVNVRDFNQCEALCETDPITCATFAYNQRSSDCLISTTTIDRNSRFSLLTQPNANYELYTFVGTSCQQEFIREFTATVVFEKSEDQVNEVSTTIPETTISTITTAFTTLPNGEDQEGEHNSEQPIQGEEHEEEVTATSAEPEEQAIDAFLNKANTNSSSEESDKEEEEEITEVLIDSDDLKHKLNDEGGEAELSDQVARNQLHPADSFRPGIPRKVASMTTVDGSKVHVNAMCLHHGVNVTFRILNQAKYTGAVYAAERFSQCRIFVEDKQEFAIFIHRPNFNNLCNALEADGELTAVLVMSNDMVLPYDVTTKDDFFYQISCDYQAGDSEDSVVEGEGSDSSKRPKSCTPALWLGSGPEPKFVMSSGRAAISHHNHRRPHADDMQTRVNLRILRNGRPVNNVFIGERLTAVVESDIDASRLSVADCNATRVGGRQPRPNSVQLIDRGCTLMPQIIGNMVRGQNGLEAPLTAFRIDGSDQIDIVCSVVVCRVRCPDKPNKCPVIRTRRAPAAKDADQDMITVDHRLRVMVADDELDEEEDEDSNRHSYKASSQQPKHSNALLRFFDIDTRNGVEYCLNPTLLFATLLLFLLCLIALIISLFTQWCNRRKSSQSALSAIYPSSTEMSGHFHIPRVERFMA